MNKLIIAAILAINPCCIPAMASCFTKWRLKCRRSPIAWRKRATSCSPSCGFRKANGNRSAHRMLLNVCTKNSSGGSRPRPCCHRRRPPRCCSGLSWLQVRSQCVRWTAGEASTKGHSIRRLTLPHDRVTSSCWRSRQNQFQHKLLRHPYNRLKPTKFRM
jgi:hypothetical protein